MQKALGERRWGPRLGGSWGEGPRDPREVHSVHWYPPGGGGGPKKRHLVLYKLAGFCTADRGGCGAFFCLHSSPVVFDFLSKMCKKCTFWPPKCPFLAIFRLFWPLFCTFLREIPRGGGDPFFGGPPGGRRRTARAEPPTSEGGPEGAWGGC